MFLRYSGQLIDGVYVAHSVDKAFAFVSGFSIIGFFSVAAFLLESGSEVTLPLRAIVTANLIISLIIFLTSFYYNQVVLFLTKFTSSLFFLNRILNTNVEARKQLTKDISNIQYKNIDSFKIKYKSIFLSNLISYMMLASGFSVSFYLMHKYPDYRLTISQVAGVIHAFGTFVVIFYLNPILSSFFDHKTSEENLQSLIATSILGRSLGLLIAGLLSAFFYVNVL